MAQPLCPRRPEHHLETRLAAIDAAVKGMPDYGSKFDLIVASLDAIKD